MGAANTSCYGIYDGEKQNFSKEVFLIYCYFKRSPAGWLGVFAATIKYRPDSMGNDYGVEKLDHLKKTFVRLIIIILLLIA